MLAAFALTASLACGVPAARAEYETPAVQVYLRQDRLLACHRATGRERQVGTRTNDGMGTDESTFVSGVLGGRWLWTTFSGSYAESFDVRKDTVTDLRTGAAVTAEVEGEDIQGEAVGLPGALVVASDRGVTVHHDDGRADRLSQTPASHPAVHGSRLYWTEGTTARTAVLTLPAGDPPQRKPLARTVGRCKPLAGARLLLRDDRLVVSRARGVTWACRATKQRRVTDSPDVVALTPRDLRYPGGVFHVPTGTRHALDGIEPATDLSAVYSLDSTGTPQLTEY
jgi:hypothetical protein